MKANEGKSSLSIDQNKSPHHSPPLIFKNQDILATNDTNPTWEQKKLINKLNYINFNDGHVLLLFQHKNTNQQILIKASPAPCVNNELTCRLDSSALSDRTNYELIYLLIDDGLVVVSAPVQLVCSNGNTLKVVLPERSSLTTKRKSRRHHCHNVSCEISQDDYNAQGELIDFTPSGLGIKLHGNSNKKQLDSSKSAQINLSQNGAKLFSGLCRCIRNGSNPAEGRVVYAPIDANKPFFQRREIRNPRQQITPSFKVSFRHPLFQSNVERDILEISTSGFSLQDSIAEETLLLGMSIPHLTLLYAGIVKMNCSAQVVYREEDKENKMVKCGLAITDMDIHSYNRINHILGVYIDGYTDISTKVDMDALWEFFFDSGFIYGGKYEHIEPYKDEFKETYRKLYNDQQDIAQHIVYKKNGKIYGHISTVRAYQTSWLIHHFAAKRMSHRLPGITVLKLVSQFVASYNRLPSANMDYVMTYYRPDNSVVDRVFGAFARDLNDKNGSSLDLFSYMLFPKDYSAQKLPDGWIVRESTLKDLVMLKEYYDSVSGGLLLSALRLDIPSDSIIKSFADAGFKRDYRTFCLSYEGKQMAFFIVNQSDIMLNLSDLLNGIKIIVVEPDKLPWTILKTVVKNLSGYYSEQNIPLLIFPSTYLPSLNIHEEKQYTLWILNLRDSCDDYLAFVNKIMKIRKTGN